MEKIKCIIEGCPNDSGAGKMIGDLCSPCHDFLSDTKIKNNSTAAKLYYRKTKEEEIYSYIKARRKKNCKGASISYMTPFGVLFIDENIPKDILIAIIQISAEESKKIGGL